MAKSSIDGFRIAGICSCVPRNRFDNLADSSRFSQEEVSKVVRMAGIKARRLADEDTCSSDLCLTAARSLLSDLDWQPDSIDALIFITQSPDYFLPQTSSILHRDLQLSLECAALDVGLGCSGYPYGLWLAAMMIKTAGFRRVLVCHGETAGRFSSNGDRAVALLFGDAGSATAIEATPGEIGRESYFLQYTDGQGATDMIIEGGGFRNRFPSDPADCYVRMDGAKIFNFTIKRVPDIISNTLEFSGISTDSIDYFILHQSNLYIMKHLAKKMGVPADKMPVILDEFGNSGGPSVPLTITAGSLDRSPDRPLSLLLVAYGVGLSWSSALIDLPSTTVLKTVEYPAVEEQQRAI